MSDESFPCIVEIPGCMIDVKPIALFGMEDDKGLDDKALRVPLRDPGWNRLGCHQDALDEIEASHARFREASAH